MMLIEFITDFFWYFKNFRKCERYHKVIIKTNRLEYAWKSAKAHYVYNKYIKHTRKDKKHD